MRIVQQGVPNGPELVRCWFPASPGPQLPNLQGTPILIVAAFLDRWTRQKIQ